MNIGDRRQESGIRRQRVRDGLRAPAKTFQDLIVWQKAHQLVLGVYRLTTRFPKHELYGLTSQFRRAAISIPANIAEGFRKRGRADKGRFMNIGQGSLEECRYYLLLARDLGYCDSSELLRQIDEVGRLLDAYTRSLLSPDF
jgi:four helix bundle protein